MYMYMYNMYRDIYFYIYIYIYMCVVPLTAYHPHCVENTMYRIPERRSYNDS